MASENQTTDQTQAEQPTFKHQLDVAANESRMAAQNNQSNSNPVVQKITEYIPAASKLLGTDNGNKSEQDQKRDQVPGPPNRPDHDPKIEEFVRDQHRSKTQEGALNTS